ncbi:MAG: hypothetical protein LBQ92_03775, partial [Propionibacteriaceae bacterium]|nr:hypothetical protein [Propionibacteriaceae bacterium]
MTLILTALAVILVTVLRFAKPDAGVRLRLGTLALIYLGAALMWCVDGIAALAQAEPFLDFSDPAVIADDSLLGLAVIALGLVVWGVLLGISKITDR